MLAGHPDWLRVRPRFARSDGLDHPPDGRAASPLAPLVSAMLACPPDRLGVALVGGDGLEPPTLSV
jgi:hypothetical protein